MNQHAGEDQQDNGREPVPAAAALFALRCAIDTVVDRIEVLGVDGVLGREVRAEIGSIRR